ncbi:Gfo/Idh/MocA family oxidoreductase [Collinsella sp. zg1085]|uniref:Gfo/Idh/MocA family protein n=1 Tax=Collinsella sp. zg1085 TaxID=2844380 RepID=UPI001C0D2A40|nr:Gfo/Idh/MocA family oxidoreductase [Collinsella sp. zg1085]QWT18063.1 Gfo/Idh/MocA family oxidoreductase [Collinsella sp. zg1085]
MIGIGIIGCGKIAQVRHIPEYAAHPNVKIVALFDLNSERATELAALYGAKACKTIDELLSLTDIDAVSICTANIAHAKHTIAALQAGKHVLCEKPMASTAVECEAMVAAAQAATKQLMIDQNQRLTQAHQKAKELILTGAIGEVLSFRTCFAHGGPETWSVDPGTGSWFFDKSQAAMGALGDLGVHKIDLIQYILDDEITSVCARLATLDKRYSNGELVQVDDNALCLMQTAKGALGSLTASWTNYGSEQNATTIFGTKGILKIYENPAYSIVLEMADGTRTLMELESIQTNDNQTKSGVIDAFVDALIAGTKVPIPGASVLSAMRVVDACIVSNANAQWVEVKR